MEKNNKEILFCWECTKCGKYNYIETEQKEGTCIDCGLTAIITEYV